MTNTNTADDARPGEVICQVPDVVPEEITEADEQNFLSVVSTDLTDDERTRITHPHRCYPRQQSVLAIHWHPETVPMELIEERIQRLFPNRSETLIIPTQHNELMSFNGYTGVEVDCYSRGFNQKVQLLLHFENHRLERADMLRSILDHTFKYRSSQLFEFIHTLVHPVEERIEEAAYLTGSSDALIRFVRSYVKKIETLLDRHLTSLPPRTIKNKVIRNFFDTLRPVYGDPLIDRAQTFLTAVKNTVKANFSLKYFFRTSEVIEEARSLNAGIVIPHPEQFWPVLLADYDVDGVEVWNPQSRRYTSFLISVIREKNQDPGRRRKPILILMGDDTHMAEKLREPGSGQRAKVIREIGIQPAWDDLDIKKSLVKASITRQNAIREYRERLAG